MPNDFGGLLTVACNFRNSTVATALEVDATATFIAQELSWALTSEVIQSHLTAPKTFLF
jgi:hypothetical protein